jgi:hypothetical protein
MAGQDHTHFVIQQPGVVPRSQTGATKSQRRVASRKHIQAGQWKFRHAAHHPCSQWTSVRAKPRRRIPKTPSGCVRCQKVIAK